MTAARSRHATAICAVGVRTAGDVSIIRALAAAAVLAVCIVGTAALTGALASVSAGDIPGGMYRIPRARDAELHGGPPVGR
jgi:hypothetical protein